MTTDDDIAVVRTAMATIAARAKPSDLAWFALALGEPAAAIPVDLVVGQSRELVAGSSAVGLSVDLIVSAQDPAFWLVDLLTVAAPHRAVIAVAIEVCRRILPAHPLAGVAFDEVAAVIPVYDGFLVDGVVSSRDLTSASSGAQGYVLLDGASPLESWITADLSGADRGEPKTRNTMAAGLLAGVIADQRRSDDGATLSPAFIGPAVAVILDGRPVASRSGQGTA